MRRKMGALIAAILSLSLVACSGGFGTASALSGEAAGSLSNPQSQSASATDGEPIKIGLCIPVTGNFAASAVRIQQGVKLAVKEINEGGGLLGGRPIKLVVEDDQANSDISVQMINKLASQDVSAIIGPYLSANTLAAADTITQNELVCINGNSSVALRALENKWYFRCRAADNIAVQALAKKVSESGATKVAIMCVNDEIGQAAAKLYMEYFDSVGMPYFNEGHNTEDTDMTGQLTKAMAEGCDAWVMSTHNNAVAVIARQMNELGIKNQPVFTNPIIAQTEVLALMEPEWIEGWQCVSDFSYTDEREFQADFARRFKEEYNEEADVQAAIYYSCMTVLADSIERAGSDDRAQIRDAMAQTSGLQVPIGTVRATADEYTNIIFEIAVSEIRDLTPYIIDTVSLID